VTRNSLRFSSWLDFFFFIQLNLKHIEVRENYVRIFSLSSAVAFSSTSNEEEEEEVSCGIRNNFIVMTSNLEYHFRYYGSD
jgi:hypothetical protein